MKTIWVTLYGNLRIKIKSDYIFVPLKILYIMYSIPFWVIVFILSVRTLGAFKSQEDEKIGLFKKIFLHIAAIFWSFLAWGVLVNVLLGNYSAGV